MKNCGVFGVSSAEYLNYAEKNRNEWASRGKLIVEEYVENLKDLKPPEKEDEESDDESNPKDESTAKSEPSDSASKPLPENETTATTS